MSREVQIRPMDEKKTKYTNVYIKNFGEEMDDEELRDMFHKHGTIISAKVMCDGKGKSRGFGFVSFVEPEAAEKAVTDLNGSEFRGEKLYCGHAQKKKERRAQLEKTLGDRFVVKEKVNLYVKNLDPGIDDERLHKEFSQFGTITSAKVMKNGDISKCFGFVCFSSPEEASKAITAMNGRLLENKALYVAYAQAKEERRALLDIQRNIQKLNSMKQNVVYKPIVNAGNLYFPFPTMLQAQGGFCPPPSKPSDGRIYAPLAPVVRPNCFAGVQAIPQQICTKAPTDSNRMANITENAVSSQQSGMTGRQDPLTPVTLAAMSPMEQKQTLSTKLFPFVELMYPDLAGKITSLLLEIDNSELLHILGSQESLRLKVIEAAATIQAHEARRKDFTKKEMK